MRRGHIRREQKPGLTPVLSSGLAGTALYVNIMALNIRGKGGREGDPFWVRPNQQHTSAASKEAAG